jgi:hypothetical protein
VSTGEVKLSPGLFKQFTVRKEKTSGTAAQTGGGTQTKDTGAANAIGGPSASSNPSGSSPNQAGNAVVPADSGKGTPPKTRSASTSQPKAPQTVKDPSM